MTPSVVVAPVAVGLLVIAGCGGRTTTHGPSRPPDAAAAHEADAGATASAGGPLRLPAKITAVGFTRDGAFATFEDDHGAVVVDLRGPTSARNAAGPFVRVDSWQTLGLPMENNPSYTDIATVNGGRLALVRDADPKVQRLEELATGRLRALSGTALEAFAVEEAKDGTVIDFYDGRTQRLPAGFELRPRDGAIERDDGSTRHIADPVTGRTVTLPDSASIEHVTWLGTSHLLVERSVEAADDGRRELSVVAFPSGKIDAKAVTKGALFEVEATKDGGVVAWVDGSGDKPPRLRCGAGAIIVATGAFVRAPVFACRQVEYEKMVRILSVDAGRVVVMAATRVAFDPQTGNRVPVPPPTKEASPVNLSALAPELAGLQKTSPELVTGVSPLRAGGALLEKKRGYEVIVFGDAGTVLTRRERAYAVCDAPVGDPCRPAFTARELELAQFSRDGTRLAVVSDAEVRVLDGRSGVTLFLAPRR